ncbi:solute carrier family 2 facilitated glucose transporter member 1 protein [Plakobranchus ocellatus]|uniref:Solute carrier family 2 facilitated glucose transporter member 1 protein n=1 Tax=Plakobranchus ocellatus TaxID=259542 RepID=A0AAV4C588_9GAST|nr:solute carrier family 2 facilitated glucose transporter member 1 protein [Plakobranchus ocellatus]
MKGEMAICEKQLSIIELLRLPFLRQPLIIGVFMQLSQQFSGINGVLFYSTSLFEDAGQSEQTAKYTTSAVGGTLVLMTLITVPLMDKAGRRTLHLAGLIGMMCLSIGVTFTLVFRSEVSWFVEVSIALVLLYVMFFALGPGSIPWLIVSELFAHDARPAALSVCVLVNWVASFVIGYLFPLLQSGIEDFVFLPFTVLLALFVTFTFLRVPETKGKTFEEITSIWREKKSPKDEMGPTIS